MSYRTHPFNYIGQQNCYKNENKQVLQSAGTLYADEIDGCKQDTILVGGESTMFIAEEDWKVGSFDPSLARKRARMLWRRAEIVNAQGKRIDDQMNNPGKWGHKHNTQYNESLKLVNKIKVRDRRRFK